MIICSTKKNTKQSSNLYTYPLYKRSIVKKNENESDAKNIYIYIIENDRFWFEEHRKKKQLETTTTNGYSSYCHWTRADRGKETFRREKPYLSQWRGGLPGRCRILDVNVPRGNAVDGFVSGVTPPQALYQHCRGRYLSIEVFLPLLLLHLQRETGAQYSLKIRRYFV